MTDRDEMPPAAEFDIITLVSSTACYRLLDTQTRASLPRALVARAVRAPIYPKHACFAGRLGRTTFILLPTPLHMECISPLDTNQI